MHRKIISTLIEFSEGLIPNSNLKDIDVYEAMYGNKSEQNEPEKNEPKQNDPKQNGLARNNPEQNISLLTVCSSIVFKKIDSKKYQQDKQENSIVYNQPFNL